MEEYKRLETLLIDKGADVRNADKEAKEGARKILRDLETSMETIRKDIFKSLAQYLDDASFTMTEFLNQYSQGIEAISAYRKKIEAFQLDPPGFGTNPHSNI
jgi:vacuolar-type H+-ATPase subunit H